LRSDILRFTLRLFTPKVLFYGVIVSETYTIYKFARGGFVEYNGIAQ